MLFVTFRCIHQSGRIEMSIIMLNKLRNRSFHFIIVLIVIYYLFYYILKFSLRHRQFVAPRKLLLPQFRFRPDQSKYVLAAESNSDEYLPDRQWFPDMLRY